VRVPKQIRDQIEQNRKELSRLAADHGMHDQKVLHQSMVLDELINEYYRFDYQKRILNPQPIA